MKKSFITSGPGRFTGSPREQIHYSHLLSPSLPHFLIRNNDNNNIKNNNDNNDNDNNELTLIRNSSFNFKVLFLHLRLSIATGLRYCECL